MHTTPNHHKAQFTPAILDVIAPTIRAWGLPVHDPFAGPGTRLAARCDELGLTFTGTEIEPEFARDPRVRGGDSTEASTYPTGPFCIVTSPAYPNGCADHFKATKVVGRNTYRQWLARTLGYDRPLHANNMGRFGVRHGAKSARTHYAIAERCVAHWPPLVVVNVSDFIMDREVFPYVEPWRELLTEHGYAFSEPTMVPTPRLRYGANADARVPEEAVIFAKAVTP